MKRISLLLTLAFLSIFVYSQEAPSLKSSIAIVPQYTLINGLRVDFEKEIKPKKFIQVCPQFYFKDNNGNDGILHTNVTKLLGGGINVYQKHFLLNDAEIYDFYSSYGLTYAYYHLEHENWNDSYNSNIHKIGGDFLMGLQVGYERVFIDLYAGAGFRYSLSEATDFNDTPWDYNYTGFTLVLGARIGFYL